MKLRTIIESFDVVKKVYDSLKDFNRKWDLVPAFNELKEAVRMFNEEREKSLEKLKEGKLIPTNKMHEANLLVENIAKNDIQLKQTIVFTKDEIKESNITGSEIALLMNNFIDKT